MTWIRIRSWNRIHFFQCKSRIQIRIKINWILNTGYHSIFVSKGFQAVFRIHLIFMAIRIRILDPHWKKWIQIPVISLRLTEFFTKAEFLSFCLIFMLKLDDPLRNQEILIISLFSIVQIWVLGVKFFSPVFGCYFTPWIRIRGSTYFCGFGSGSRKPKFCGS